MMKVILGPSGAGKTRRLNEELSKDSSYAIRTATTAQAALISAGVEGASEGRTIHSVLNIYKEEDLKRSILNGSIYPRLRAIAEKYRNIAIDEISICSALFMNYLGYALKEYNNVGSNPSLGLICMGDFAQLPHVNTPDRRTLPVFHSIHWKDMEVEYLTKVYRQDNPEFIHLLSKARLGRLIEVKDWLKDNIEFANEVDECFQGITIFSTNKEVNFYNERKLAELSGYPMTYPVKVTGKPPEEFNRGRIKDLIVKKNALVTMMVNNLKAGYANGSLGIVEVIGDKFLSIRILRTGQIVDVHYVTLQNKPIGAKKSLGSISFIPVRIAYASTIHSVQGQTITDKLQLKLGGSFLPKLSGGVYVVLSRVNNHTKLRIVGTPELLIKSNYIDPIYIPFVKGE